MLKLGLAIDWGGSELRLPETLVQQADRLGFDSVWCAEAYGSDAITPLAYLAAKTRYLKLGTGIAQVAARTPASMAMQMNTLDALSGGRALCGLGMSGPQIVEGWYGQPWGKPAHTLRDYVAIMRKILARTEKLVYEGRAIQLPCRRDGALGVGKALKSILHTNPNIPIYLGTGSQTMVTLTAEIADGWIPFGFVPGMMDVYRPWLEAGFSRAGGTKSFDNFEIWGGVHIDVRDDVQKAWDAYKPFVAFYVGGMGHKDKNFHKDMMVRRGYPEAAERIQELFLSGRMDEAARAVPDEYVDDMTLVGPPARIQERYWRWVDSGVTGLILHNANAESLALMANIAGLETRDMS